MAARPRAQIAQNQADRVFKIFLRLNAVYGAFEASEGVQVPFF